MIQALVTLSEGLSAPPASSAMQSGHFFSANLSVLCVSALLFPSSLWPLCSLCALC